MQKDRIIKPKWDYYCKNSGAILVFTDTNQQVFYFSYQTLVAFRVGEQLVCHENVWSSTTGKHLNRIEPDKSKRVNKETFDKLFTELVE